MIKCLTIIQIELEFGNVGFEESGLGLFSYLLQILTISVGSLKMSRNFRVQVQKQLWILVAGS